MNTFRTVTSGIGACIGQSYYFAGRHADKVFFTLGVTQVALTHLQSQGAKQMERIYSYKDPIYAVSITTAFYGVCKLIGSAPKKHLDMTSSIVNSLLKYQGGLQLILLFSSLGIAGVSWTAYSLASRINEKCKPSQNLLDNWYKKCAPEADEETLKEKNLFPVTWGVAPIQNYTQAIYLVSMVTNISLGVFSKNNKWLHLGLGALQLTSMLAVSQWRWIQISTPEIELQRTEYWNAHKIRYKYFFSVFQSLRENTDCAICLEEGADTYFCSNHTYHLHCALGTISEKLKRINIAYNRLVTSISRNYHYSHDEVTYTSSVSRNDLPNCPECRGAPRQNEIHVDYYDKHEDGKYCKYEKWISAKVKYTGDSSTFWDKAMPVLVWLRRNLIGM